MATPLSMLNELKLIEWEGGAKVATHFLRVSIQSKNAHRECPEVVLIDLSARMRFSSEFHGIFLFGLTGLVDLFLDRYDYCTMLPGSSPVLPRDLIPGGP